MSEISLFSLNYTSFSELLDQYNFDHSVKNLLTTLFFNYAELTWSSSFTHGVNLISFEDEAIVADKEHDVQLIHKVLQLGNWAILGALLTFRMTAAIPILAVTLAGKLYHSSSFKVASEESDFASEESDLFLNQPSLETTDNAILPIVNTLKELGGQYLKFGIYKEPIDLEQFKELCRSYELDSKKTGEICNTIDFNSTPFSSQIKEKDNQIFLFSLKLVLRHIVRDESKESQSALLKRLFDAFDLKGQKCIETTNTMAKELFPDQTTLEGHLFNKFFSYYQSVLEEVQKKVDEYTIQGWSDLKYTSIERIPSKVDSNFSQFFDELIVEFNKDEDSKMIEMLQNFHKKHPELEQFGLYREGLRDMNWYIGMPEPTEAQIEQKALYISKGEMAYLFYLAGVVGPCKSTMTGFRLEL